MPSLNDFSQEELVWTDDLRSGRVRLTEDDNPAIELDARLHADERAWRNVYEIEVSRLNSDREVLDWIAQLFEKNWMSGEMMRDFVAVLHHLGKLR